MKQILLILLTIASFAMCSCDAHKADKEDEQIVLPKVSGEMAPEGEAESLKSSLIVGPAVTEE